MAEAVEEFAGHRESDEVRFTYSRPEQPLAQRALVRTVELFTGQPQLERLYRNWARHPWPGENIFAAGIRLLEVELDTDWEAWARLPAKGPLLIVANHPYGVIDGLALGHLATRVRPDTRIMTHSLLCQPPEARDYLLPVDFGGTPEAQATTLATRRRALGWLGAGHALAVFPGGSVATSQHPLRGPAIDPAWHPFVAKLARQPDVTIVPVYFHGRNSRLFQLASHTHYALRIALLFRESARRIGTTVKVSVGTPFSSRNIAAMTDRAAVLRELRRRTYALAGPGGPDPDTEFRWPAHINWD
jgi:putative hemolysin